MEKNINLLIEKNEIKTITNHMHYNNMIFMNDLEENKQHELQQLRKDMLLLKDINSVSFKELNSDTEVIKETNKQLQEIENDLLGIDRIMKDFHVLFVDDAEKLLQIEDKVTEVTKTVEETLPIIDSIIEEIKISSDNKIALKLVSGAVIGGLLLGGVGSIFGIIPAIICTGVGSSSGVIVGYFSKYI